MHEWNMLLIIIFLGLANGGWNFIVSVYRLGSTNRR